jgi:mRNA-degrading endonuclease toxin of MazEF toxin-antitoxin module
LKLYSSKRGVSAPNLVAIQSAELEMLPTVLVCPLREGFPVTGLRVEVECPGGNLVVLCELTRPIHRRVLELVGELSERDSSRVMETFNLMLAR